jgi:hypothetical protein
MTRPEIFGSVKAMKTFPWVFLALCILSLPALAEDWTKKDPEALAKEARKISADLRKEAEYFESSAHKEGRTLTADEKKYLTYTIEEATLLEKSYEAWDKNQKRMAEKFREKAGEFCHKRGEMAAKLKLWEEKEKPAAPQAEKKKDSDTAAKLAEIEKQQAELEKKKKDLQEAQAAGH